MPFKTFGKLAGNVANAVAALSDTTPPERRSPATAVLAGTKWATWNEPATSRAWNRMLGALAANDEQLGSYLDTPAVRDDVLHYFDDANTGFPGNGKFGFPALWFHDPNAVGVANQVEVNLGAEDTGLSRNAGYVDTNVEPPPAWVYVGLSKEQLASGKVMRLQRDPEEAENIGGGLANRNRTQFQRELIPDYIKTHAGAVSEYHKLVATAATLGDSPHSPSDHITPITPVTSDIRPYNGAQATLTISSWESDGPVLTGPTLWEQYHVRPGCYLVISGSAAGNNGLWLVKSVAGDKAVLTSGSLIKVTVETGGGASFAEGQMITWASPPNHATTGLTLKDRDNRAYVAKIDTDTLWLIPTAMSEDGPSGGTQGSKVAHIIDSGAVNGAFNTVRMGDVGYPDRETSATENWTMPVGTKLYPVDYTSIGSTTQKAVVDVWPAGYPVVFDTTGGAGTAVPHNPPGFLLNPILGLEDMGTLPHKVMGGKYYLQCKTLTTNREKMSKGVWGATVAETEDPSGAMVGNTQDHYANSLKAIFDELHHGQARQATGSPWTLNPWDAPTRNYLGSSLWMIQAATGGALGIGTKFLDGSPQEIEPATELTFVNNTLGAGNVKAFPVAGWDDILIVRNPRRDSWSNPVVEADPATRTINVGTTLNDGVNLFTVSAVHEAEIEIVGSGFVDAVAANLNAAYNALYSGEINERGNGQGNVISMTDAKPVTMTFQGVAAQKALKVISGSTDIELLTVADSIGDNAHMKWDGTSFTWDDVYATTPVPFTTGTVGGDTAHVLPSQTMHQSILGALKGATPGGGATTAAYSPLSTAPIRGGAVSDGGGLTVNIAAGTYMYKGALWEVAAGTTNIPDAAADNYIYVDFSSTPATYGNAVLATAQTNVNSADYAFVGMVTGDGAGGIASLVQMQLYLNRDNEKREIYVGNTGGGGTYSEGLTHYQTVGEAMYSIGQWSLVRGNVPPTVVKLVGNTTETSTILWPADNVVLEGVTSGSITDNYPSMLWSGLWHLFDVNQQSNITIRNVQAQWNGGNPGAGANPTVVLLASSSIGTNWGNILLENVRLYQGHGMVYLRDTWDSIVLRNCVGDNLANTGVTITSATAENGAFVVEGCSFHQLYAAGYDRATNNRVGIEADRFQLYRIENTVITGAAGKGFTGGILLTTNAADTNAAGSVTIKNNHISVIDSADAINIGADIGDGVRIHDNTILLNTDLLITGTVRGIYSAVGASIKGNHIETVTGKGIEAAGTESIIADNTIRSISSKGILVTGTDTTVARNTLNGISTADTAGDNGCINTSAKNTKIIDNTVTVHTAARANIQDAILVDVGADHAVVSGNRIIDPSNDPAAYVPRGIEVNGEGSTVSNNNLDGGHITLGAAANWSTVSGNIQNHDAIGSASAGIDVSGYRCAITGNSTGGGPIILQTTAAYCTVSANSTGRQNASYPFLGGDITVNANRCTIVGNALNSGDINLVGGIGECVIGDNKCAPDEAIYLNGVSGITAANPAVVTTHQDHGLVTGMRVDISGAIVTAPDDINDTGMVVTVTGLKTFSVVKDTSGGGAPTYGLVTLNNDKGKIDLSAGGLGKNTVHGNFVRGIDNISTSDRPRHKSITLTGTVDITANTNILNANGGAGTVFQDELEVGDWVEVNGEIHRVLAIASQIQLTLVTNHVAGAANVAFSRDRLEYDHNYVT